MSHSKRSCWAKGLPSEVMEAILCVPNSIKNGHLVCQTWRSAAEPEARKARLFDYDLSSLSRAVAHFAGLRDITLGSPPSLESYRSVLECINHLSMLESVTFVGWNLARIASAYPSPWKEGGGPSRLEFRTCAGDEGNWRDLEEASSMRRSFGFAPFEFVPTVLSRNARFLSDLVSTELLQKITESYIDKEGGTDSEDDEDHMRTKDSVDLALCFENDSLAIPYNQFILDHLPEVLSGLRVGPTRLWILETNCFERVIRNFTYPYLCGIRELHLCFGDDPFEGDVEDSVDLLPSLQKITLEDNGGWFDEDFAFRGAPNPEVTSVCLRARTFEEKPVAELMKKFPSAHFRLTVLGASDGRADMPEKALEDTVAAIPRLHPVVERAAYNPLYA